MTVTLPLPEAVLSGAVVRLSRPLPEDQAEEIVTALRSEIVARYEWVQNVYLGNSDVYDPEFAKWLQQVERVIAFVKANCPPELAQSLLLIKIAPILAISGLTERVLHDLTGKDALWLANELARTLKTRSTEISRPQWLREADMALSFVMNNMNVGQCIATGKHWIQLYRLPFDTGKMPAMVTFAERYKHQVMDRGMAQFNEDGEIINVDTKKPWRP